MKGIFVILDGIGDLPHSLLQDRTPLEAAEKPNLDFFASRGEMGTMIPVKQGFVPESDEAIISIFGNELESSSRGQLEARGTDLKLTRGDLAFRVNFASIDSLDNGNLIDRRAGRTLTTDEAKKLAKALKKIKLPVHFDFVPTIQHRAVLVFRGGFSDQISGNDSTYSEGKLHTIHKIGFCRALDDEENTEYTVNIVNEFLQKSFEVLDKHPVNLDRKKKGLMPANYLLIRGAGIETPKLKKYKKWLSLAYMPLEIGFSRTCGMDVSSFEYPKLKKMDVYENLYEGLKEACEHIIEQLKKHSRDYNYFYIHIKETDLPGHDNKPVDKKLMIEYLDKTLFRVIRQIVETTNIKLVVTADHSTPCKLKAHSSDPVPVLLYNNSTPKERRFSEKEAKKGFLGEFTGKEFMKIVGFDK